MNNPQQKLFLRHALLLQLAAAAPIPLPLPTLRSGLRLAGHPIEASALLAHLDYLAQKQYIRTTHSELSAADHRYSLSAIGRDYLEAQGLI